MRKHLLAAFAVFVLLAIFAGPTPADDSSSDDSSSDDRDGFARHLPRPLTDRDFLADGAHPAPLVELGRLLFFDKLLSGNRNISCASCHHPNAATGDGLALSVGEGGVGLGGARDTGSGPDAIHERVPRNAPPIFNLGAREYVTMFHDGRVQVDPSRPSGFRSPAGELLPDGLTSALAVQAMFPVTSATEMAGQRGENPIADAAEDGDLLAVWSYLAARLAGNDEYVERFVAAFDDVDGPGDITFVHAANAIAAFEADAWRADDSPFDRWLRGDRQAMSGAAMRGMRLFYGRAGCASCHSGPFQTDHDFHATAMPQIGPGKGAGLDGRDDIGREAITGAAVDRYRFRTATLRNVALTGPWGHDGAYDTLEGVVRHMVDPVRSLASYDRSQLSLPLRADLDAEDFVVLDDPMSRAALAGSCELEPARVTDAQIDDLVQFLHALTDQASLDLRSDIPDRVPSGLPLAE